ncbi:hypothetical protein G9A89_003543 [Geosiphon pyriformis]|nr:hypothetical protein G9A89_003543 [Geosiphon pyriformis]
MSSNRLSSNFNPNSVPNGSSSDSNNNNDNSSSNDENDVPNSDNSVDNNGAKNLTKPSTTAMPSTSSTIKPTGTSSKTAVTAVNPPTGSDTVQSTQNVSAGATYLVCIVLGIIGLILVVSFGFGCYRRHRLRRYRISAGNSSKPPKPGNVTATLDHILGIQQSSDNLYHQLPYSNSSSRSATTTSRSTNSPTITRGPSSRPGSLVAQTTSFNAENVETNTTGAQIMSNRDSILIPTPTKGPFGQIDISKLDAYVSGFPEDQNPIQSISHHQSMESGILAHQPQIQSTLSKQNLPSPEYDLHHESLDNVSHHQSTDSIVYATESVQESAASMTQIDLGGNEIEHNPIVERPLKRTPTTLKRSIYRKDRESSPARVGEGTGSLRRSMLRKGRGGESPSPSVEGRSRGNSLSSEGSGSGAVSGPRTRPSSVNSNPEQQSQQQPIQQSHHRVEQPQMQELYQESPQQWQHQNSSSQQFQQAFPIPQPQSYQQLYPQEQPYPPYPTATTDSYPSQPSFYSPSYPRYQQGAELQGPESYPPIIPAQQSHVDPMSLYHASSPQHQTSYNPLALEPPPRGRSAERRNSKPSRSPSRS